MMAAALLAGLTAISAATAPGTRGSWSCASLAERLPRSLALLGDDTVPGEETRAARERLGLVQASLTRASSLALAQALGATRLVIARCEEKDNLTLIEARSFDPARPVAGDVIRASTPQAELAVAIDDLARRLAPAGPREALDAFRSPSPKALAAAGAALAASTANERGRGLSAALAMDPGSLDLRLSTVEALMGARDFEGAIRTANVVSLADSPALLRALQFRAGSALLEAGRYLEAAETFEALRRSRESAAVLNNLGVARFRLRDPFASALFNRAGFLPDHRQNDISFNRALALLFEDRADAALVSLNASIEASPSDVRARLLKVWALRLLNREAERAAEWERLVAIAPSFASLGNPDLARRLERIFFSERTADLAPRPTW
jgi:tetratricopeptide (TPR) repeat protein